MLYYAMNKFSLIVITLPKKKKRICIRVRTILFDNYISEYNILRIAGSTAGRKLTQGLSL